MLNFLIWEYVLKSEIFFLPDQSPGDCLIDMVLSIATYPMRSRWEESGKNSLWQIFRAVVAYSYLQYRLAHRTEQFHDSRAQHFNPDLYGSSRSCSLLQCGFHGDPWELSFDFIFPFYFIFNSFTIFIFLRHPIACKYLILAHLFQTASFVLGTHSLVRLNGIPRDEFCLELVPAWLLIHAGGNNFHVSTDIQHDGGDDTGRLPLRNVRAPHGRLNGVPHSVVHISEWETVCCPRCCSLSSRAGLIEE